MTDFDKELDEILQVHSREVRQGLLKADDYAKAKLQSVLRRVEVEARRSEEHYWIDDYSMQ